MSRTIILVEGQTEENFVNQVLAPHLGDGRLVEPVLVGVPQGEQGGGDVRLDRLIRDAYLLLDHPDAPTVTTFVDYFRLGRGFQKQAIPPDASVAMKKATVEGQMASAFRESHDFNDALRARFIPYVQMHEFEALLFSDPGLLGAVLVNATLPTRFGDIRDMFETPEHINDSVDGAPSRRIENLSPGYNKAFWGALIARDIGFDVILRECRLFGEWVAALRGQSAG